MNTTGRSVSPVKTPIGEKPLDNNGSCVGAARINPANTFAYLSGLLKLYIKEYNPKAWEVITKIIDNVYKAVSTAMEAVDAEAPFSKDIFKQVEAGKRLFFKVNLVALPHIDYITHGIGVPGACTEWAFTAAVMRWFHDKAGISYHRMIVGDSAMSAASDAEKVSKMMKCGVTREAIMEGKYPGGAGGWGFYFSRKYLSEKHNKTHQDDPMNGYGESLVGHCTPPGSVDNRLLLYDLSAVDEFNGREVPVAGGENFQTITMHKAVVGGDPNDPQDIHDWPGCVLINLPKLKVHVFENFSGAVKNIGVGLYPLEVNTSSEHGKYQWKYGAPDSPHPCVKFKLPHTRYVLETDYDTLMPIKDNNGEYIWKKTGGMQATMADGLQAVKGQGITMFHVADLIEIVNINNNGFDAKLIPEGLVLAGNDPVALDVCAARYMYTMAGMAEVDKIRAEYKIDTDIIQKTPLPEIKGNNIITGKGYDSSYSRYSAMKYCEERGLGQRQFYIIGEDLWRGGRLASVGGRLGRVEKNKFDELLTATMYHAPMNSVNDLQRMSFAYLEMNDKLTGSNYKKQLLDIYDENHDGVIDFPETGRGANLYVMALQASLMSSKLEPLELAKCRFLVGMSQAKIIRKEWNTGEHALGSAGNLSMAVSTAFSMSQADKESPDPLYPGRQWGKSKWPSLQYILRQADYARIYGRAFPGKIDVFMSPYGQAFFNADVKYNGAKYCSADALQKQGDIIAVYLTDVEKGTAPLPFTIFVPKGMSVYEGKTIPNVTETDDAALMFTASFDGKEDWKELHLSEFNLT